MTAGGVTPPGGTAGGAPPSEPAGAAADGDVPTDGPGGNLGSALLKLLVVVAAVVALAIALRAVGVLVVVAAVVAIIMLHELGHFVTAKLSGMKVTEYFLGFGPRLWAVARGETTYGVKAIPAGGYVKITGMTMLEDVAADDEPRSYRQASFPKRVLVASAGSIVHFLLAFLLLWIVFAFAGVSTPSAPTVAGLFSFGSKPAPATLAGFRPGDQFVSIDGRPVPTYDALTAIIAKSAGHRLEVTVRRNGRLVRLYVTPASRTTTSCSNGVTTHATRGEIGVDLSVSRQVTDGPIVAFPKAAGEVGSLVGDTFAGLAHVFSLNGLDAFAHQVASAGRAAPPVQKCPAGAGSSGSGATGSGGSSNEQLLSILGAIQLGSQLYSYGPSPLLVFLAFLNLFIGIVNLFPMLPLDGGHVAIAVYERLRSRNGQRYHADVTKLLPVAYVFMAFILIVGIGALYSNILQPVHLPGG